jgi:hypothetical protein
MIALAFALVIAGTAPDGSALTSADLPKYREALAAASPAEPPPRPVKFAELWRDADRFVGRRVIVEGVVVRRFGQGPIGEFPALTEAWIDAGEKNLICLAFPTTAQSRLALGQGEGIRFSGTFLKTLRYRADVDRLAPLIVGAGPPERIAGGAQAADPWGSLGSKVNLGVAAGAGVLVVLILALRHAQRPVRRMTVIEPAPEFVDGGDEHESD